MKKLILISALVLVGCNNAASGPSPAKMLTYEELSNFDTKCELADQQQALLKSILIRKNFDPDPDNLNDNDRAYNSLLKATLWWYEYRCGNKKQIENNISASVSDSISTPKSSKVKSAVLSNDGCSTRMSIAENEDGTVSSNTLTVCGGEAVPKLPEKVKIGDNILENEVAEIPALNFTYFKHRHSKCRLFRERYMFQNVLQVNHGIICQTDPNMDTWSVVDKW